MRGDGWLSLRGGIWQVTYYRSGVRVRESLKTADEEIAKKKWKALRKAVIRGTHQAPADRKVTVGVLLDDLAVNLKLRQLASLKNSLSHMRPVRKGLGHLSAAELDTATVERYQADRLAAGRKPATVNRECQLVRQAFNLAFRRTPQKVVRLIHFPTLPEQNARQGFLSKADFGALLPAIADPDIRDFVEWFWWTGMRPGEIRRMSWAMVDREARTLNLDPTVAKTREGRVLALEGPLRKIIDRREAKRRLDCPLVFHRPVNGRPHPIGDFYRYWRAALEKANLPSGLIPYDLRRSALRNMIRGGTDYTVAMKISGHRSRSTFDRYNITDEDDVRKAILRTEAFVKSLPKKRKVEGIRKGER